MSVQVGPRPHRRPSDFDSLWFGQGRARMIEVYKNLGFYDVCECDRTEIKGQRDRKSMLPSVVMECTYCHYLIWPMQYIFDCDECTEPFLVDKFPPVKYDELLLCPDCEN